MWNQTNNTSINAPATGIIQKSNPKSFMVRMHWSSDEADLIFRNTPTYKKNKVSVLQVVNLFKDVIFVELIEESNL